ncbi:MAG: carboxylesterase family protein [Bacteroidia bacterium]|nr:carboxylesterase family protein [Bacteroidia bacterium]
MKHLILVAIIAIFWAPLAGLMAQSCASQRYLKPSFGVDTTLDVIYGNAPAITTVYVAENVTTNEDLLLDVYQPAGDTLALRPCVILAFGGGFLIGSKEDEDIRSTCDSLARLGYVAVSINYRLNLNVADAASGTRAAYRGMQDFSAAIRFVKENAAVYKVDTNYIFSGGVSAGGISAMGAAFMKESDRPAETFANNFPARPDLGCFDCSGNQFHHSRRTRAVMNFWGAVQDTLLLTANDAADSVPLALWHGDLDPVVPFNVGFPFTGLITLPQVFGSNVIHARRQNLGLHSELTIFPQEGHNVWGTVIANNFVPGPSQYWNQIQQEMQAFIYQWLIPSQWPVSGSQSAWVGAIRTYTVPVRTGFKYCWSASGGNVLSQSGNSVTIEWTTPGFASVKLIEVNHLEVPGLQQDYPVFVGTVGVEKELESDFILFPNPASDQLRVKLASQGLYKWEVVSMLGNVLLNGQKQVDQGSELEINVKDLPDGNYLIRFKINSDNVFWADFVKN